MKRHLIAAAIAITLLVAAACSPTAPGTDPGPPPEPCPSGTTAAPGSTDCVPNEIKEASPIAAGRVHTCALPGDGTVRCWGDNSAGQLGNGSAEANSSLPVTVSGITDAVAITSGANHSCAVLQDGTARCWGENIYGQLGSGTTGGTSNVPVTVSGLTDAVAISAARVHTCALLGDGTARCWGYNNVGQLGHGIIVALSTVPVTVSGLTNAVTITSGGSNSCALLDDGTAQCWGWNGAGQLGNGTTGGQSNVPVAVPGLSDVVDLSAGDGSVCAVVLDGTARCWGDNVSGQLGNGTTGGQSNVPVAVSGVTDAADISVGVRYACTVLDDGTARCWGNNANGQLGNDTTSDSNVPVIVSGLTDATDITTGGGSTLDTGHTCALRDDGTARCWGTNRSGQLGNGTSGADSNVPVAVSELTGAVDLTTGNAFSCALLGDGTARCWGDNASGQLGNAMAGGKSTVPVAVSGLTDAVDTTSGSAFTCALLGDATARCWGDNANGQLGNGTVGGNSSVAAAVSGLTDVVDLDAGSFHSCAVLGDGTVRCWGSNNFAQLGDGTTTTPGAPVTVPGITDAVAISAGGYHTCALLADGTGRCWGRNSSGQLGSGTTSPISNVPVTVSGLTDAVDISAGSFHSCAVLGDGTARCWGNNVSGMLGNGANATRNVPVTVSGLTDVVSITAGSTYTCALLGDGTARCWGDNTFGRLGNGTDTNSNVPVAVSGLTDATAIAASSSSFHSCALLGDGTARCWGYDGNGQLGNGAAWSTVPGPVLGFP